MEVKLNIYTIKKANWFGRVGLGAYHTGVQIGNREYCFSDYGVLFHEPLKAGDDVEFEQSIVLGADIRQQEFNGVINQLRPKFAKGTYNVLKQNCNHFTDEVSLKLFQKHIPSWINRPARLGVKIVRDVQAKDEEKKFKGAKKGKSKSGGDSEKRDANKKRELNEKQKQLLEKLKKEGKHTESTKESTSQECES